MNYSNNADTERSTEPFSFYESFEVAGVVVFMTPDLPTVQTQPGVLSSAARLPLLHFKSTNAWLSLYGKSA
jgi:hypothetical protein